MKIIFAVAVVLVLQACATSDALLEVHQSRETVATGPISEVAQTHFEIMPLADEREDKDRVGYKRNTYGMKMADIATAKPVADVVTDALQQALTVNGHAIGSGGIQVSGAVQRFWTETDINFSNIEVLTDVDVLLTFTDTVTSGVIHERSYTGHGTVKASMVTEKKITESLVAAVANLVEDLVLDEDLADALRERDIGQARTDRK